MYVISTEGLICGPGPSFGFCVGIGETEWIISQLHTPICKHPVIGTRYSDVFFDSKFEVRAVDLELVEGEWALYWEPTTAPTRKLDSRRVLRIHTPRN
jgi:hypothetical protein